MNFGVAVLVVVMVWSLVSIVASVTVGALARERDVVASETRSTGTGERRLAS